MTDLPAWQAVVIGLIAAAILFWFVPGIKRSIEVSKDAPKDWVGLLVPIVAVILFIVLLTQLV